MRNYLVSQVFFDFFEKEKEGGRNIYFTNPHFRWTMDFHTCGYSPRCLDVETIALHKMGHSIGLGHQKRPLSALWSGYDYRSIHIHQCEANAMCWLHSAQLPDKTPVPPTDNKGLQPICVCKAQKVARGTAVLQRGAEAKRKGNDGGAQLCVQN